MSDYSMRRPIEGEELLQWYQLEGSKVNGGKGGYEMYPLAINLTDTIQAINQGLPAPYVSLSIFYGCVHFIINYHVNAADSIAIWY